MVGVSLGVGVVLGVLVIVGVLVVVGVLLGVNVTVGVLVIVAVLVIVGVSLGVGLGPGVLLGVCCASRVAARSPDVGVGVAVNGEVGSKPGPVRIVRSSCVKVTSTACPRPPNDPCKLPL